MTYSSASRRVVATINGQLSDAPFTSFSDSVTIPDMSLDASWTRQAQTQTLFGCSSIATQSSMLLPEGVQFSGLIGVDARPAGVAASTSGNAITELIVEFALSERSIYMLDASGSGWSAFRLERLTPTPATLFSSFVMSGTGEAEVGTYRLSLRAQRSVSNTDTGQISVSCTLELTPINDEIGACCSGTTCALALIAQCGGMNQRFVGAGEACNAPGNGLAPCCRADFNQSGGPVTVQDVFDFLAQWFNNDPLTDINGGGVSVQDVFDFLGAWFAGC